MSRFFTTGVINQKRKPIITTTTTTESIIPLSPFDVVSGLDKDLFSLITFQIEDAVFVAIDFVINPPTNGIEPYTYQISKDGGLTWESSVSFNCGEVGSNIVDLRVFDNSNPTRYAYALSVALVQDNFGMC